ncbi:pyruvate decarboxylase [Komagataeibacter rhaeticus]|uniref:alpha-keto acid decarboxylase family protein n=1 Tax=Komagataeibacter rhaeticus TaxID=215221 RepID=UPI0004D61E83|nr:thiamine pyrophosphate-binding protein [Komagataeibacter rhaeticus]KDU95880.1 pyruvate decarboxylase [Komagataeibacter rhaeticus AF1]MBL7240102.1 alpha-keto acid decarboxylase family protein [Komagataeibacter rhaeticus]PYD54741.1 pyruvate decarboxylase [Komagataeibacter rhaeticus]
MRGSIGSMVLERLRHSGVSRIYGVPGDYNLEFLELIERTPGIEFIGTCNELNAAYAADGDARLTGIGAVLVTYGVGDLSALSAVAGACAEGVPLVVISGMPPWHAIQSRALVHHTLADGNYDNVMACYRQFAAATARLHPASAVTETDRVLHAARTFSRPVYIQFPSDICYVDVEVGTPPAMEPQFDPVLVERAADLVVRRIRQARQPLVLVDALVRQYGLVERVQQLCAQYGLPYAALSTARTIMAETGPEWLGAYGGRASAPHVADYVHGADCVIGLGVRFVDSTSGYFSQEIGAGALVDIQAFSLTCDGLDFQGITAAALLDAVWRKLASLPHTRAEPPPAVQAAVPPAAQAWEQAAFWPRAEAFLRPGDVVVADNGSSMVAMLHARLPAGCSLLVQPVWAAIGYSLPASLGACLATPHRRHVLFIGDGSFQMTAQELSTLLRHRCNITIFLINNGGYTIERMILGPQASYNDIANWDYASLPAAFGSGAAPLSLRAGSIAELDAALVQAAAHQGVAFVEVGFTPMDAPPAMAAMGQAVRRYDYGIETPDLT